MTTLGAKRHIAEEPSGSGSVLNAVWRPAGLVYLATMLIGLAVGLWPGSIRGSGDPYAPGLVPAVQTLTVAQTGFYLLAYPVIVMFRTASKCGWRWWPDAVVEMLFWTFIAGAFFVPAVWLSGSVPLDALSGMGYVCTLWPMAWVCGVWLASGKPGGSVVMFTSVFIAIGLPWLWYVSAEFFASAGVSETLWRLCPATQAWDAAAARGAGKGLTQIWAMLAWPLIAAVMFALWMIIPEPSAEAS
ncbi:MAG: hypothetical protein QGG42_05230 [Phycisphaerae bacterium]|jgi:hypothetical protein|nr:hypothetical protein [Phycisphaerae bacterium]